MGNTASVDAIEDTPAETAGATKEGSENEGTMGESNGEPGGEPNQLSNDDTNDDTNQVKYVEIKQNNQIYSDKHTNNNNNINEQKDEEIDEHKDEHKDEQKNQTTQTQNNINNNIDEQKDDLLKQMGFGQFWDQFVEQGFDDPEDWDTITEADLIEMGMKKGKARKFLKKVKQMNKNNDEQKDEHKDEQKNQIQHVQVTHNNKVYNYKAKLPAKKKECSLLFVGETGVGKSTLLKSFEDFINGVPYEKVRSTPKSAAKGQSQTQDSSQFLLSNDEWAVNIIDTPGIGDTGGFSVDQQHLDNIIKHIGQFGDFNAVCILIKRGTTRKSTRMSYIIGELKANMPKDVKDNFITIMTRSDVPIPDADTLGVIKSLDLPVKNIIPINNCSYEELDLTNYPDGSPMREIVRQRQRQDYYANHKYLQILLDTASKMKPYKGDKIVALKIKRDKLKEQVGLLKMKIDDSFKVTQQIKDQIGELEGARNEEEQTKAWKQTQTRKRYSYIKKNDTISTACNACNKVCHIDCGLSYGDDLNSCSCAGRDGKCYECKCSMSSHAHLGWESKEHTETVDHIDNNLKLKWKNAKDRQRLIQQRKDQLEADLKKLDKDRENFIESIKQKYRELESIAIIGYNENFGTYIEECMRAVNRDTSLTTAQKKKKTTMFAKVKETFDLLKSVVKSIVN